MSGLKYSMLPTQQPIQLIRTTSSPSPAKKQKMSLTQTYMLAHSARGKLSKEASKPDHNLRRLVGHANMLDNLMIDLQNAEQEQEQWFNDTVSNANKTSQEPKHIQWADTISEEAVEEEDSDSDSEDEEYGIAEQMPVQKITKTSAVVSTAELEDEDEEMEDDDDYEDGLALTRTSSHNPPELMHEDSDSESEDDSMPPSPTSTPITFDAFSDKQRQAIATTSFYQSSKSIHPEEESFFDHDMPTAIAAY